MGTSWGQCSELCGVNHAYMPIEIKVLYFIDFMFFMELGVKEIILPHLLDYYKLRISLLQDWLKKTVVHLKKYGIGGAIKPITCAYVFSWEKWSWLVSSAPPALEEAYEDRLSSYRMLKRLHSTLNN